MTQEQAELITNLAKKQLEEVLTKDEADTALIHMTTVLGLITEPYLYTTLPGLGVIMTSNPLPILDKRFPEVLRTLANVLEVYIELENK